MKRHIYRPGDKVRITVPLFVRRVGYPLVWYEVTDEQLYADPAIGRALLAFGLQPARDGGFPLAADDIPRHLQIAFAKEYVLTHSFGGNARTIHYWTGAETLPNVFDTVAWGRYYRVGTVHTVVGRRHVKTGTRYPAGDEDPGGLNDMKVHTLLKFSDTVEIEACNVEPV